MSAAPSAKMQAIRVHAALIHRACHNSVTHAEIADWLGTSQQRVCRIFNGHSHFISDELFVVAARLGLEIAVKED